MFGPPPKQDQVDQPSWQQWRSPLKTWGWEERMLKTRVFTIRTIQNEDVPWFLRFKMPVSPEFCHSQRGSDKVSSLKSWKLPSKILISPMNNNIGAVRKEGIPYNYPTASKLIVLKKQKITRKNTYMIVAGPQFETICFFGGSGHCKNLRPWSQDIAGNTKKHLVRWARS